MILIVLLYMLFAVTFTLGKSVLMYVPPLLFVGIRMMLGGSLLLVYCFVKQKTVFFNKNSWTDFLQIIIFHIFCAYTLEFWALKYVTSSKACLAYNLSPFFTALFAYILFKERLSIRQIFGLIIGFAGFIPVLVAQTQLEQEAQHFGFLSIYEIALIVSVASSSYGWIIMKKLMNAGYSFILINGIGMVGGGVCALIFSFFQEGWPTLYEIPSTTLYIGDFFGPTVEALIVIGMYSFALIFIANIICYNLYGYLLSHYSPTLLSFAGFLTPLFAALFGWVFLNETVSWHFFVTIVFVIFGLYIFSTTKTVEFAEEGL